LGGIWEKLGVIFGGVLVKSGGGKIWSKIPENIRNFSDF
jgi:hypothetical protein